MDAVAPSKEHRAPRAGAKAKKKKAAATKKKGTEQAKGNNPRAFIFKSSSKARKARTVAAEKQQRKLRAPIMDRTGDEPPPSRQPAQRRSSVNAGDHCPARVLVHYLGDDAYQCHTIPPRPAMIMCGPQLPAGCARVPSSGSR